VPKFLTDIENIGKAVLSGIEKAAPIVEKLAPGVNMIPLVGPSLVDAATLVAKLEQKGQGLTAAELETVIVSLVQANQIKQAVSTPAPIQSLGASVSK
jgi:hypothetical protein